MDFKYYIEFFHDGTLIDVCYQGESLFVCLESCQLSAGDNRDNVPLIDRCVRGTLEIVEPTNLEISDRPEASKFEMFFEEGEILDFEILPHHIWLGIQWSGCLLGEGRPTFSSIEIRGREFWWNDEGTGQRIDITNLEFASQFNPMIRRQQQGQ